MAANRQTSARMCRRSIFAASFGVASAMLTGVCVAQEVFPPPASPESYTAFRASDTIVVDGRLEEPVWQLGEAITEFIQKDPDQGAPASYPTEVRLAYDETSLYVAAICFQPRSTLRVQTLKRDFLLEENDLFGIAIDGFRDRRNAVAFQTTPFGNQRDLEIIDSVRFNTDWDARWDVRTRVEDDRWVVEMAIPWRTLRYPRGADTLGVIFTRNIRSRNEYTSAPAIPRLFTIYRMAYQAELVDLQTPQPTANVQINPYALVEQADVNAADTEIEFGGGIKWAISPSTVLDLTANTDFAQADVDRQVVNLERFSVFFPERRPFFLENANIFNASVTNWIRPFFSRRIGLDNAGRPIPLDGGLRLTNRSSAQEFGFLAMSQEEQGDSPAALFGVARYSRNVGGQSRLGGMLTWRRDRALETADISLEANDNLTYTLDGVWRPNRAVGVRAMVSVSEDERVGSGIGGQLRAFYENNWLYAGLLEYFNRDYAPGIGLEILDTNYVMHSPTVNLDLRSDRLPDFVRSFSPGITAFIFQSSDDGDLLFGYAPVVPARVYFHNGAQVGFVVEPNWQRLDKPFSPAGVEITPGKYDYTRYRLEFSTDQSAKLSGRLNIETGDYFDGELTNYFLSARYAPTPNLELSADVNLNAIRSLGILSEDKDTTLYGLSARFALNPRIQFTAYYQRNDANDREIWNARLAWEYQPLSFLYLVYNRNDASGLPGDSRQSGGQLIAKFTYRFEV